MFSSRNFGFALLLGAVACQGVISEPGQEPGGGGSGTTVPSTSKDALLPAPRVARLSHQQWENTIVDLFGFAAPTGQSASFPSDPSTAGFLFENDGDSLSVDSALWGSYQRAATEIAEQVVADAAVLARILPPDSGDDTARAKAFIQDFGKRAYRRPLSQAEQDELLAIYQGAPAFFKGKDPFMAGVQLLLSAFLQSPHFLYRIESSTKKSGGGIPLTGWELASRLSYMLWNRMPDDQLFQRAESGELSQAAGVSAEAKRLLADEKAADVVTHFHQTLLEVEKYEVVKPLPALFPDAPSDLGALAKEENDRFIRFLFQSGGGYRDVLTSNVSFVNDDLAKVYGLSGSFDASFKQVTLDPATRRGVFTQVGFLAANATSADPDPIHRGAFLARRVNCLPVAAPPNNVPPLPPADGRSNRATVEAHTEEPGSGCDGCHAVYINPFGFAFENYDAVGAYRTKDGVHDVNSASEPLIDDQNVPVQNALELADVLADSKNVHECYAQYWVEYSFGRKGLDADVGVVRHLGELSKNGQSIEELIVSLVTTPAFRNRSTVEMP